MIETIIKASLLISIIGLGFLLKKIHILKKEDFKIISTIVMKITLPCALIVKLNGFSFSVSLLGISIFSFFCCVLYMIIGYFSDRRLENKQFAIVNITGYNIGNFTLPFVSYFFDAYSVLIACLFDVGNALCSLGGTYGFAKCIEGARLKDSVMIILRNVITSIPILVYLIMVPLGLFGLSLPHMMVEWCEIIAQANTFLSMLMIGIAIDITFDLQTLKKSIKLMGIRYGIAIGISMVTYYFLPVNEEVRFTLLIMLFSPVTSMATVYTNKLDGDLEASAFLNSLMIIISIVIISMLVISMQI